MPDKNTWEQFFDGHASVYDGNVFTKNTVQEVNFPIEELRLPPGGSILDVGCGTAGNWGKRPLDLDEIEIMIAARKTAEPSVAGGA